MRTTDAASLASGWISDSALAAIAGDDPSDAPASPRSLAPELGLLAAVVALTVGDVRRGDPDALAWLDGEPSDGFSLADVADAFSVTVSHLRSLIIAAARHSRSPHRKPGAGRQRRAA